MDTDPPCALPPAPSPATRHRFEANPAVARLENRLTAVAALVGVPAALWLLRDERNPLTLALFGIVAALAAHAYYAWRDRRRGLAEIEVDAAGLRARTRQGPQHIDWTRVRHADRSFLGGEHWVFTLQEPRERVVVRLDGLTPDQSRALGDLIRARTGPA